MGIMASPAGLHSPLAAQTAQQKAAEVGPTIGPPSTVPGAKPSDTADNIPAKISPDEFVVPAYAVRFFGLNHFHKLLKQAQDGLHEMDQNSLIKKPDTPSPSSSPSTQQQPAPITSAGGGFFASGGTPSVATHMPVSSFPHMGHKIPHNTGLVHTGVASPFPREMSDPKVRAHAVYKLASGGFMNNDGMLNTDFSGQPQMTASGSSIYKPNNTGLGGYPYSPTV